MFGSNATEVVFTLGAFAVWACALGWALTRDKDRWYHTWVLALATLFWWIGESLAIRLGKYEYPNLGTIRLNIPFGGTPTHPGWIEDKLLALIPAGEGPPWMFHAACKANDYAIPLSVVALEAALLFGFFRFAASFFRGDQGRWRTSLATGGLCALLMVNLFAVLDPVVSTYDWCQPMEPHELVTYLPFGLWRWHSTLWHQPHWYGVPLINYAGWFLAAFVFGTLARYDDARNDLLIRRYRAVLVYALVTVVIVAVYIAVALGLLRAVSPVLVHGQEWLFGRAIVADKTWQLLVVGALLGVALLACWRCRRGARAGVKLIWLIPKALGMVFCLWLLWRVPHWGIFKVWVATAVVAFIVLLWPHVARRVFADDEPPYDAADVQPPRRLESV
jgi:hypothetical protein